MKKVIVLGLVVVGFFGVQEAQSTFRKKTYAYNFQDSFESPDDIYDSNTSYGGKQRYSFSPDSFENSRGYNSFEYQKKRPYSFGYGVVDDYKGLSFSHKQNSDGKTVTGGYDTLLPDGRIQRVTYIADEKGYRAKVTYEPHPAQLLRPHLHDSHEATNILLDKRPIARTYRPVVYPINPPYYIPRTEYY